MLAARDEGVGTCWIGLARPWFNLPGIKAEILRRRDSLTRDRQEQDPPVDTPGHLYLDL